MYGCQPRDLGVPGCLDLEMLGLLQVQRRLVEPWTLQQYKSLHSCVVQTLICGLYNVHCQSNFLGFLHISTLSL